jgi:STE24 endopeptidase
MDAFFVEKLKSCPLYRQAGLVDSNDISPYYWLTIAFTVVIFVFESYLDLRQLAKFTSGAKLPEDLKKFVAEDVFTKSISYGLDKFQFKIVESNLMFLQGMILCLFGFLPYVWDQAILLTTAMGLIESVGYSSFFVEIAITWMFIVLLTVVDTLTSLPFSLYKTFVLEEKHGFNKTTLGLYVQDKIMTLILTFSLSMPILSIVVWLVRIGGPHFYFYIWLFLCVVGIILMTVYPVYIAPLFNKYSKLEDQEVMKAIDALAAKVSFPLTQVFQVDGSKRSAHSNAYFYGFFKNKRIVLYDTLLKQVTQNELLAILGHEIGHWKLWHTIQGFFITQIYTFCLFLAFSYVQHTPALFTAFGFVYTPAGSPSVAMPVFVGLILFSQTFWSPVEKVLSLLMTYNSRYNEFAADSFACGLDMSEDLASGLIKISLENLDNFVPDSLYSSYHYSHPPLVERLKAIRGYQKDTSTKKTR